MRLRSETVVGVCFCRNAAGACLVAADGQHATVFLSSKVFLVDACLAEAILLVRNSARIGNALRGVAVDLCEVAACTNSLCL